MADTTEENALEREWAKGHPGMTKGAFAAGFYAGWRAARQSLETAEQKLLEWESVYGKWPGGPALNLAAYKEESDE